MTCPHCQKDIPDTEVAKHFASIGGKVSKRTITPEQQARLQQSGKQARERRKMISPKQKHH